MKDPLDRRSADFALGRRFILEALPHLERVALLATIFVDRHGSKV
jgi:hypothetical protein